jgi:hypothetical protein
MAPNQTSTERQMSQTAEPTFINTLLQGRASIEQLAALLNPDRPVSERSVYNEMDRLNVPYVKVLGKRWYDLAQVKAAILASETTRHPRGRGRPRKAA